MANLCKWMAFQTVSALHIHAHTQSAVTETHFRCFVSLSFPSSSSVACITFAYGLSARYTRATHTCLYRIRAFRTFVLSTTDAHKQYPQHIQSCYIACHMRPKSIWGFIYVCGVWCAYAFPKCIVYFALTLDWKLEIDKIVDLVFWIQFLCLYFLLLI